MSEAPFPEPEGYLSAPGFVKSNPLNNDHYVEQFKDDPWYEIIKQTHDMLTRVIPGYNISQIKQKFGGLRYYVDYPKDASPGAVEKARSAIRYAEAFVNGFEYARSQRPTAG